MSRFNVPDEVEFGGREWKITDIDEDRCTLCTKQPVKYVDPKVDTWEKDNAYLNGEFYESFGEDRIWVGSCMYGEHVRPRYVNDALYASVYVPVERFDPEADAANKFWLYYNTGILTGMDDEFSRLLKDRDSGIDPGSAIHMFTFIFYNSKHKKELGKMFEDITGQSFIDFVQKWNKIVDDQFNEMEGDTK